MPAFPPRRRAALAQNFFRHAGLARRLASALPIEPGDLVYDLGAGSGLITTALVGAGARVVAVERDANLAAALRRRFEGRRVRVVEGDLEQVRLAGPYKVCANLPFNATATAVRRLLVEGPPPEAAVLVLQLEAARRYAGRPRPTASSLKLAPWFELDVTRPFARHDFVPAPAVETAVLHVVRRREPLVEQSLRTAWEGFVGHVLGRGRRDARGSFRSVLSRLQWRRLCGELAIAPDAALADLTPGQWIGLFRFAWRCAPPAKRRKAFSAAQAPGRSRPSGRI